VVTLRAGSRGTTLLAAFGLAAGLTLGGCEAILGTGSLGDRPGDSGTSDGTVGGEAGGDTGTDTGTDAVAQETGSESGTDATVTDGGSDGSVSDAIGTDASDAHNAGDSAGDSTAGDSGTPESGVADSGIADSGIADSGIADSGIADSGVPETAPETGPPPMSCAIVGAQQRQVNAAGATISADGLAVLNASDTNVLALAVTGTPPSLAWQFRSDRPGDTPTFVPLQSVSASPARLAGLTRSVAGNATYVLANDQQGNALLWNWPDNTNITSTPTAAANRSPSLGSGQMVATSQGIFYALNDSSGGYADFQVPPALPSIVTANLITTVSSGMSDGARAYRLSDDRVSLIYVAPDGTSHQNEYAANSTTVSSSRLYYSGNTIPYAFQPNGTNVDVSAVLFPVDAAVPIIATATIPESQLFTFDPGTVLQPVALPSTPSASWCVTTYPGKLVFLSPTIAGMDLYVIDVATATLSYSLTGASNLVHPDTAIVNCAIAHPVIAGTMATFEVVWTDNAGGGPQNLEFAPLQCTL
jgi:hypothetical protein